jgi:hypothetical protein
MNYIAITIKTQFTKTLLSIVLWSAIIINSYGQSYEPTILILSPNTTISDKVFKKEIEEFNFLLRENQKQNIKEKNQDPNHMEDNPENIKVMYQKQIEFLKDMDFYNIIPAVAEGYLQYRFFQRFQNLLIYATKEKSNGNVRQLTNLARKHKMQYIINFPQVHSFIENNSKKTTIRVQLFDDNQKKIILDKEFTGHDRNPGFEFTCNDRSLFCTINNSLSQALGEIISIIASNNPTIIRERELINERSDILFSEYYPKEPAKEIPEIIHRQDSSFSTVGYYHGFMDESKTKFIGFFAMSSKASNFQEMRDQNDNQVQIISDDIFDLDLVPKVYANIVVGVNYNSKWYLKKDKITYFNSENFEAGKKEFFNNLQKWGFFKENSSDFNPDFWETHLFEKVKDVSKEPDYEKYYESIYKSQERRNKEYIGMYEIVAEQIRIEQSKLTALFIETIEEHVLMPFFEQQKTDKPNEFAEYYLMHKKFTLIFPKDRSIVLTPVQIKNSQDQRQIRYFVVFPESNEIYEWTYLKTRVLGDINRHYGSEIIDQLSTVTDWNFGFETLDDYFFWSNYVLIKDGDKYQYLKKLKGASII